MAEDTSETILRAEQFAFEVDGTEHEGVISVNPPTKSISTNEERAGDDPRHSSVEFAGVEYADLDIEVRLTDDMHFWEWVQQIIDGQVEEARIENAALVFKDSEGNQIRRWNFTNIWPKKYKVKDADAMSAEILTAELTFAVDKAELDNQ